MLKATFFTGEVLIAVVLSRRRGPFIPSQLYYLKILPVNFVRLFHVNELSFPMLSIVNR